MDEAKSWREVVDVPSIYDDDELDIKKSGHGPQDVEEDLAREDWGDMIQSVLVCVHVYMSHQTKLIYVTRLSRLTNFMCLHILVSRIHACPEITESIYKEMRLFVATYQR